MERESDSAQTRGLVLAGVAALLAAGYLIPYKAAAELAGPDALALPMLLAAAALNSLALVPKLRGRRLRPDGTTLRVALALGVCSALGNESMAQALGHIDPGLASSVLRVQVLLVAAGGWILLGERVSLSLGGGAVVALAGFTLLRLDLGDPRPSLAGVLWVLVAAASFGAMQLIVRRTVARIDHLLVNALRLWLAAGMLACLPGRAAGLAGLDGSLWGLAAAAAVFGPVASRLFLMASLRSITATMSTLMMMLSPVAAFAGAGLVLGLWPGPGELIGAAVIMAGVAWPVVAMLRTSRGFYPLPRLPLRARRTEGSPAPRKTGTGKVPR